MKEKFSSVEEIVIVLCCINSATNLNFFQQYHLKMFEECTVFHDCPLTLLFIHFPEFDSGERI